jgi:hypothetical protein
MKRSMHIRLILMGGLSAGTLAGCGQKPTLSMENVYTNNFYVPGAGYYHAPFRNWYALPYNYFNPGDKKYFYGGKWGFQPFESVTNISAPTMEAASLAQSLRTDVPRGGFGGHGGGSYYYGGSGYHDWGGWS